jgi:hypothetical protein
MKSTGAIEAELRAGSVRTLRHLKWRPRLAQFNQTPCASVETEDQKLSGP